MTKEQLEDENKALKAENEKIRTKLHCVSDEFKQYKCENKRLIAESSKDLYSRAVSTYGEVSWLILAIEEMSELAKELSKYIRGKQNIGNISEEMADVEITLEQLKSVFANRAAVDIHKAQKLQRLSNRLDGNHDDF